MNEATWGGKVHGGLGQRAPMWGHRGKEALCFFFSNRERSNLDIRRPLQRWKGSNDTPRVDGGMWMADSKFLRRAGGNVICLATWSEWEMSGTAASKREPARKREEWSIVRGQWRGLCLWYREVASITASLLLPLGAVTAWASSSHQDCILSSEAPRAQEMLLSTCLMSKEHKPLFLKNLASRLSKISSFLLISDSTFNKSLDSTA